MPPLTVDTPEPAPSLLCVLMVRARAQMGERGRQRPRAPSRWAGLDEGGDELVLEVFVLEARRGVSLRANSPCTV